MYSLIDGICFLTGLGGIVIPIALNRPAYCPLGIVWIVTYPLLNELIYNVGASMFGSKTVYDVEPVSRLIYSEEYNLTFCGLEKLHPFDGSKYKNIISKLVDRGIISHQDLIKPNRVPRKLLLQKMSPWFLVELCYSIFICRYIEMPLFFLPSFLLRWRVLNPSLAMTEGTIIASTVALKRRWAINVGGGLHHAHFNGGGGFCIYPDISLAAHYLQTRLGIKQIMIIDLDAHQGNGHQRDHVHNSSVYTVDCYNHNIYPRDKEAKEAIRKDLKINIATKDDEFLRIVRSIQEDIDEFKPDFIIYNAGTDILEGDPLGNCSITPQGIIKRDETVFEMALKRNIPLVMVTSGGYQLNNAQIIADSIENLLIKYH